MSSYLIIGRSKGNIGANYVEPILFLEEGQWRTIRTQELTKLFPHSGSIRDEISGVIEGGIVCLEVAPTPTEKGRMDFCLYEAVKMHELVRVVPKSSLLSFEYNNIILPPNPSNKYHEGERILTNDQGKYIGNYTFHFVRTGGQFTAPNDNSIFFTTYETGDSTKQKCALIGRDTFILAKDLTILSHSIYGWNELIGSILKNSTDFRIDWDAFLENRSTMLEAIDYITQNRTITDKELIIKRIERLIQEYQEDDIIAQNISQFIKDIVEQSNSKTNSQLDQKEVVEISISTYPSEGDREDLDNEGVIDKSDNVVIADMGPPIEVQPLHIQVRSFEEYKYEAKLYLEALTLNSDAAWLTPKDFYSAIGFFPETKLTQTVEDYIIDAVERQSSTIVVRGANRAPICNYLSDLIQATKLGESGCLIGNLFVEFRNIRIILVLDDDEYIAMDRNNVDTILTIHNNAHGE